VSVRTTRGEKAAWTVLVYLAGDNNLDQSGVGDLLEMKKVGSTPRVNVVAEFDRGSGRGAKRYLLRKGGTLAADAVASVGRLNTGDPKNLLDFVRWGVKTCPAERYALVLWNHGQGWDDTDIYADERHRRFRPLARGRARRALFRPPVRRMLTGAIRKFECRAILLDDDAKDFLDNGEMKRVLAATAEAIGGKLDVLGMDACLMSMAEVGYQIRESAAFTVGSEQTEPGDGWPYDRILRALSKQPEMGAKELSATIVREYLASFAPADGVTQSACDLAGAEVLARAVAALAESLLAALPDEAQRGRILAARSRVQAYEVPDNVDLVDFCELLAAAAPAGALAGACRDVVKVVSGGAGSLERGVAAGGYVLASGSKGADLAHSHGVAIYFPTTAVSPLYARLDWAQATGWGRFLEAWLKAVRER
jgi:hypothetical protein